MTEREGLLEGKGRGGKGDAGFVLSRFGVSNLDVPDLDCIGIALQ